MSIEMVNIFDENQNLIGSAPRDQAHREGLLHDVIHCWIYSPAKKQLWFQQRSATKTAFPLYYDIAVGGHITAGEDPADAAIREVYEEIGLQLSHEDIVYCGSLRKADYISEGLDREIGRVYLCIAEEPQFTLNDEVERMVYVPLKSYLLRFETESVTAYTVSGQEANIPRSLWAGAMSREFEDFVLPHIQPVGELRYELKPVCEDLAILSAKLDRELDTVFGRTELRAEHALYNTLDGIDFCIIAYNRDLPVACAAMRPREGKAEIKRVYVSPTYRGRGTALKLMELLETESRRRGFKQMILETNTDLLPAMELYKQLGYEETEKYPPYENMPDAYCMAKDI